jgi:hypothetical protein
MKVLKFIIKMTLGIFAITVTATLGIISFNAGFEHGSESTENTIKRILKKNIHEPNDYERYIAELEREGEAINPTDFQKIHKN